MIKNEVSDRLTHLERQLRLYAKNCIGFPGASDFDYREVYPFFDMIINNVGDPAVPSLYTVQTKELEQEVIQFFAGMWRAPANDFWGYITTGTTEGNMYGLYTACETYPEGILYYAKAAHYSISKAAHILGMSATPVAEQKNGEIDYDALRMAIRANVGRPAIVVANIGTTMTEATDDVTQIKNILNEETPGKHYIHADAALVGGYAPFMESRPHFDFADGADSIAVSGHKFIGMPFPCGVVMVRASRRKLVGDDVAYIGTPDTTITGSRSGHAALLLWYGLQRHGVSGLRSRYKAGREMAVATIQKLQAAGCAAWSNPGALTVIFPSPQKDIVSKWQLATAGGKSHIICMPGVSAQSIDACIADIAYGSHI